MYTLAITAKVIPRAVIVIEYIKWQGRNPSPIEMYKIRVLLLPTLHSSHMHCIGPSQL